MYGQLLTWVVAGRYFIQLQSAVYVYVKHLFEKSNIGRIACCGENNPRVVKIPNLVKIAT